MASPPHSSGNQNFPQQQQQQVDYYQNPAAIYSQMHQQSHYGNGGASADLLATQQYLQNLQLGGGDPNIDGSEYSEYLQQQQHYHMQQLQMGDYNELAGAAGVLPGTALATATTTTTTSTVEDIDLAAADAYGNYYPPSASHYHHHYPAQAQQQQQPQYMVQYGTVPAQPQDVNGGGPSAGGGAGNGGDGTRWRNPNLVEVIQFLKSPNNVIKANAAAYLQHLCYMDDPNKQKTRQLGGIPPLIELIKNESFMVYRNALGALRNLSYGRQNDENKRQIKNYNGITELMGLLVKLNARVQSGGGGGGYDEDGGGGRKQTLTPVMEMEIKELITGIIWNMSSCEDIKRTIIDDSVDALVQMIIIPYSGILSPNGGQVAQIFATSSSGGAGGTGGGNSNSAPNADNYLATVFRNATGIIRNISSAGEYARQKLRETPLLIQTLVHIIKCGIDRQNIGNKIIENCVCILRNLSYRLQEIEDPNYDKMPIPLSNITGTASTSGEFLNAAGGSQNLQNGGGGGGAAAASGTSSSSSSGSHLGCFGVSKKKKQSKEKEAAKEENKNQSPGGQMVNNGSATGGGGGGGGVGVAGVSGGAGDRGGNKNYELLFQPEVIQFYLQLLQSCSNPETLEAAAGAIQNLAACYWQPSIEIRAAVRKEKGLPILVELLRMEVDRVVCAVATSLRNLAIDQRNKELIGKYAMRDLIQKLPTGNVSHDQGTSDDTIAAVLATLNEVIKKNCEFCRSLLDNGGVERLMIIVKQKKQNYTPRVLKFTGQLLYTMWQHQDLRDAYKKCGWKESDFVYLQQQTMMSGGSSSATNTLSKSKIGGGAGGGGSQNSSASNTLSLHHQQSPNSPPTMGGGGQYGGQMQMGMNTLSRPMASQGGTRYEDRTIKRNGGAGQARSISVVTGGGNSNYSTLQHQRNGGLTNDDLMHEMMMRQQMAAAAAGNYQEILATDGNMMLYQQQGGDHGQQPPVSSQGGSINHY